MFFPKARKVNDHIDQLVSCGHDILRSQLPQILPCKDNIVAVDQKIFLFRRFSGPVGSLIRRIRADHTRRPLPGFGRPSVIRFLVAEPAFDGAVCALEDPAQLVFLREQFGLSLAKGRRFLRLADARAKAGPSGAAVGHIFLPQVFFRIAQHRFACQWSVRRVAPAGVHMHALPHLVPRNRRARPVRAEDRSGRIAKIQLRIIARRGNDLLCIGAGLIALERTGDLSLAARVGCQLLRIIGNPGNRRAAGDHRPAVFEVRLCEGCAHLLQIRERSAQRFLRNLHAEAVERLQKDTFCHHKSLPYRAVGSLAEVAALCVLEMGSSGKERDLHICDLRAGQNAPVPLLLQMGHDQALPVDRQYVRPAAVFKYQSAPGHAGFEQQMDFRIMAQRLEMADALYRPGDRLFINNGRLAKRYPKAQSLPDHPLQDLLLHLAHDLRGDLLFLLIVGEVEGRIFFLEGSQAPVGLEQVFAGRQKDCTAEDRLQELFRAACLCADSLSHSGPGEAGHGAHFACDSFLPGLIFTAGIEPDLFDLLGASLFIRALGQRCFDRQSAAGELHPGQSCAAVSCDLEDPGAECIAVNGRLDQRIQALQERRNALLAKRRAEQNRKELAVRGQPADLLVGDRFALQVGVQKRIVADCDLLLHVPLRQLFRQRTAAGHHVHAFGTQFLLDGG